MSREHFEMIRLNVAIATLVYGLFNLAGLGAGLLSGEAGTETSPAHQACSAPTTRIGYIVPGFRLGCWLSEVPK